MKKIYLTIITAMILAPVVVGAQSSVPITAIDVNAVSANTGAVEIEAISVAPSEPVAQTATKVQLFGSNVRKGVTNDDVQTLQQILAQDPSVYPEGITSGYFGNLTESALKRLQAKYGLPQTGVVDEATRAIIFPTQITLQVAQPNGGEVWEKGTSHRILWKTTVGPQYLDEVQATGASVRADMDVANGFAPFFGRVSVDLIRDSQPNFLYHIGTANLYESGIAWNVPERIRESKDYRVRVSVGGHVPCLYELQDRVTDSELTIAPPCPLIDIAYAGQDTSDRTFAIVNGSGGNNDEVVEKLKNQLNSIEGVVESLLQQISEMRRVLNTL